MKPLLLDRSGDALSPSGCHVVEHERDLLSAMLQCALTSSQDPSIHNNADSDETKSAPQLMVKGQSLCDWAEMVWRGRNWPCENRLSPLVALQEAIPGLQDEALRRLWSDLGEVGQTLPQPYLSIDLLAVLYPTFDWDVPLSRENAAKWLLWLDTASIPSHHRGLLANQVLLWRRANPSDAPLYVATPDDARRLLRAWLRLSGVEENLHTLDEFPAVLPPRWLQESENDYKKQITRDGVKVWDEKRILSLPPLLIERLADITAEYLLQHRATATAKLVNSLLPFLPGETAGKLRGLRPPLSPTALPQKCGDVIDWVTRQYLSFRLWQAELGSDPSSSEATSHVETLGRAFGEWYLGWYSKALLGSDARYLATKHAEDLRSSEESAVVLWVIADGLGWIDAQRVAHYITTRSPRFSLEREEATFSPVPTITQFCKDAVRWGTSPVAVEEAKKRVAPRHETGVAGHLNPASELKKAQPGDIIIWKPSEPDKTYHEIADRTITRTNVEGALRALADSIFEAASVAPEQYPLKIVLTTDHGRLLGGTQRRHRVPDGFESHGRAAFRISTGGEALPEGATTSGVTVQGNLAFLNPDRFDLLFEVVVPLDDGAFLTNSREGEGRRGTEEFPHGGVFPEEVVVPWFEFERDARPLQVSAHITGRARPGLPGRILVFVENPNALTVEVQSLSLRFGTFDQTWQQGDEIVPYGNIEFDVPLESWPQGNLLRDAQASLILTRPDGRIFSATPTNNLEAEEMQIRDDDFADDDMFQMT